MKMISHISESSKKDANNSSLIGLLSCGNYCVCMMFQQKLTLWLASIGIAEGLL